MSIKQTDTARTVRRRRSGEEAREAALASARKLLIEKGPDAVTLKAVAADIGTTHSNLLHHFGTAADLQAALMSRMVRDLSVALEGAVTHLRSDEGAPRALIDQVFDAFEKGGAGRLAAWIALSGNFDHLGPVREAVADLVDAVNEKFSNESEDARIPVTSAVLFIAYMAFADAVIGEPLKDMVERERTAGRRLAAGLLPKFFLP